MPPFASTAKVTLHGIQGGQTCENILYYFSEANHTAATGQAIAEAAREQIWEAMDSYLCSQFRMLWIAGQYSQRDPLLIKPAYQLDVDEPGTNVQTEVMPAQDTVNMMLIPDPESTFPETNHPLNLGWRGFSGFPEAMQNNGLLNETAEGDWNTLFEGFESLEVDVSGSPVTFNLGLWRPADRPIAPDTTATYAYVLESYANREIGRRGSRKR